LITHSLTFTLFYYKRLLWINYSKITNPKGYHSQLAPSDTGIVGCISVRWLFRTHFNMYSHRFRMLTSAVSFKHGSIDNSQASIELKPILTPTENMVSLFKVGKLQPFFSSSSYRQLPGVTLRRHPCFDRCATLYSYLNGT
jgi:hypothetical protein